MREVDAVAEILQGTVGDGSWVITEMKAVKCWINGDFEPSALQQRAHQ